MILDRIVVENFGVYGGRHEAVLTPPDPQHPITLFGGNNGAGKTTLLKALFIAFYGKRAPLADRNGKNYDDYLKELIHDEANPHLGARVEVQFRKLEDGQESIYKVSRRWWISSKGVEERLEVFDGLLEISEVLSESWDEFIEDYLPARIANLFFFDGEQIKNLADPQQAAELLRTAVQSLLGLEIVERLSADLMVLERRKRQAAKSDPERLRLEALQQEIQRLEELQETAVLANGEAQTRLDRARKALDEAEDRYAAEGGGLLEQRGALRKDQDRLEADLKQAEMELRELSAGPLPFALVPDMLKQVEEQMAAELEAGQALAQLALLATRDNAMLGHLKRQKTPAQVLQDLRKWLEHDQAARQCAGNAAVVFDANPEDLEEIRALRKGLPELRKQTEKLIAKARSIQQELDGVDRRLAQVPNDEAIRGLHEAIVLCREKVRAAETEQGLCADKRDLLFRELTVKRATYGRELEKNADIEDDADSDRRILAHSARVRATLEAFHTAAIARRVGQLEQLILDSFVHLIRKPNFVAAIKIDPATFEVHLLDPKGRAMPMARLSAGESQLLATAMLWGLARASGRVVPTLIDTPLGRLDSSHRKHLVERYFPHAAHQVILLSTDEEINQCHLDRLRSSVGNTYRLDYDPATRSTTIQEGYLFP